MEPNEDNAMGKEYHGYEVNYRTIMMRIEDGSTLMGKVNIRHRQRLSEIFLDAQEQFIILVDVKNEDNPEPVIFVNKNSIMWAKPID